MKLSGTTALLALATTAAAGVARIPIARNPAGSVRRRSPRLTKRATLTESLINNVTEGGYFASVSVGTPGQDMTLILDTGSSDAWVVAANADLCSNKLLQLKYGETCGATFDRSSSSTYKNLRSDFEIQYVDGSAASGAYFTDDFTIGDTTVKDLQMGLADETAIGTGILGIGFNLNEAAEEQYSNLVTSLVNQSLIPTTAYSLYLNDYYSSTGSILFGGVDTDKFIGTLDIVPILPDALSGNYSSFTVGLTGLSFAASNGTTYDQSLSSENGSLNSILDSGTTLTYLPDAIATELFDAVGAYQYSSYLSSGSIAMVDCRLDLDLTFRINGTATITVPADELVIDAFAGYEDTIPSEVPFGSTCLFGIQSLGDASDESGGYEELASYAILGDTFLRSAYVVYDLDHLQVGLAPANLNSTSTNVQELSANATGLPQLTGVASQTKPSSSGTSIGLDAWMLTTGSASMSTKTCSSCVPATSVAPDDLSTANTSVGARTTSAHAGVTVSVTAAAPAGTSGASVPSPSSGLYGPGTATVTTTTSNGVAGSSVVSSSSSSSFADRSIASHKSAALGRPVPGCEGLFAVVTITLAFATSGSLLFWL